MFDVESKCRVSAIRACVDVAEFVNIYEWKAEVFEDMVLLMTDEKTSVRKEAL